MMVMVMMMMMMTVTMTTTTTTMTMTMMMMPGHCCRAILHVLGDVQSIRIQFNQTDITTKLNQGSKVTSRSYVQLTDYKH